MPYPISFRAVLLLVLFLAGATILFIPSSDPLIERRRVALRTAGIGIVSLAVVLLAIAALLPAA
ncbi:MULTISPECIES: hypothetical protein [unclassified Paraburkholderia]|uniref:hypothetical protein n=1 Tax=unclassified Paraburkholderia TaxID=2615204 RepID=UPI00197F3D89|nr:MULTISPECIES: hypothetical protein [unclassified Paraburkholderia]MBN3857772.1 hypothetical protein [Paraburkholderia sp. Ac-20340]